MEERFFGLIQQALGNKIANPFSKVAKEQVRSGRGTSSEGTRSSLSALLKVSRSHEQTPSLQTRCRSSSVFLSYEWTRSAIIQLDDKTMMKPSSQMYSKSTRKLRVCKESDKLRRFEQLNEGL
jgi:hypothetical protein